MNLDEILSFDPFAAAEKMGGGVKLGFALNIRHSQLKKDVLLGLGDTVLINELPRYLSIIEALGFNKIYEVPFVSRERNEKQFAYWHDDGIFLVFDTYYSEQVNSGHLYYNWIPAESRFHEYIESGHLNHEENVWVGYHDCREALVFHINRMRVHGKFLPQWVEPPNLWMCHYGDVANFPADWLNENTSDKIRQERIALIPEEIRKRMKQ